MTDVSITSSPVSFEVLSEQYEWAMFRGIDFIADSIQKYFEETNHVINPLSRVGQRCSLWQFYKSLNAVEVTTLDYKLVESFDYLKATVFKGQHRDWETHRLTIVKALGVLDLIKFLKLDASVEIETVKDLQIKTFSILAYQESLNKLFKKAFPSLTSTHPEQKVLAAFMKDKKVSKSGVFALIQTVQKEALAATKKEIYTFLRKLEVSSFPEPREVPVFFDAPTETSSQSATLQPNATNEDRATQGPYASPKQSSSSASKGTMPVIQALTKTVADLKKKSTAKDPLTSILKDAAEEEEEEEAGPATRTSRSQPKVTAKETNARKRGRAAIQEEEEEEEDIEEDEEEEEAPPKTRSPQPVTSPSRTAQPAPSSLRAIEALASHKYAPAAPKPSGSLIQAGRPGEKVSFGDDDESDAHQFYRPKAQRKRIAWSEDEDTALINGLTKYGPGSWSWIKKDAVLNDVLIARSNVDLKDRVRNLQKHGRIPSELVN